MEHSGVVRVLIETLCEIQISSGLPAPELTEHSKPLDLDEFDSLKCLELASNSPPSNGSGGSITIASSSRMAISPRPSTKSCIIRVRTLQSSL